MIYDRATMSKRCRISGKLPASQRCLPNASSAGFTLIELLVVVAIVALLVGMLVPTLSRARLVAKSTVCAANLRALGSAAAQYRCEFDDYVPVCWKNTPSTYPKPWKSWRTLLAPYTPSVAAFNCPGVPADDVAARFASLEQMYGQDYDSTANAGSYGIVYQDARAGYETLTFSNIVRRGHPVWSQAYSTKSGGAWTSAAQSIYVADACPTNGPLTYPTRAYKGFGTSVVVPPSDPAYSTGELTRRFADRHYGTNCLFVSGEVKNYVTSALDSMRQGSSECVWDTD